MTRMLMLPDTHPLHRIIDETKANPPQSHPSSIASLIKTFKLGRSKMETIIPMAQLSIQKANYTTLIAGSRDDSIKQENKDDMDFKVFSDGSGCSDGVGAAAILFIKDWLTPINKLKYFIGSPNKHNTFEAEAVGTILATAPQSASRHSQQESISIYQQSGNNHLNHKTQSYGQYILKHLNLCVNNTSRV